MAGNINVRVRTGYQAYFDFFTGLLNEDDIVSTTIGPADFTGRHVFIDFADGSQIDIHTQGPMPVLGTDGDGHLTLDANPVLSLRVFSPSDQELVLISGDWGHFNGPLFGPNFLSPLLSANGGNIQPFDNQTVADDQIITGYGAPGGSFVDRLTGGSGNDTLIFAPGTVLMNGGPNNNGSPITGNDTFLIPAGTSVPITGQGLFVHGTSEFFPSPLKQPGEVDTLRVQSNQDFTYTEFRLIDRIVYDGATELLFAAGQFPDTFGGGTNRLASNTTVVGDNGANALEIWMSPDMISVGHANTNSHGLRYLEAALGRPSQSPGDSLSALL